MGVVVSDLVICHSVNNEHLRAYAAFTLEMAPNWSTGADRGRALVLAARLLVFKGESFSPSSTITCFQRRANWFKGGECPSP